MSEIHGATGSYVINALDPAELDEFEAHLAVCPTCSQEVVEFCETAAELSLLAVTTGPPPELRGSILAAIGDVRPLPPELPVADDTVPRRALIEPVAETEPVAAVGAVAAGRQVGAEASTPTPAPVDELAARRARRRTRVLALAVAAVTVVALSMGGWAFSLVQARQSQVAEAALETQLFSAADVKIAPVKTENGGQISFVSSKSLNKAMVVSTSLPAAGADRRYQLWTLQGEAVTPDALFDAGTHKQWFSGDVSDSTGLAVTVEPETGSQVPTLPIQAKAAL